MQILEAGWSLMSGMSANGEEVVFCGWQSWIGYVNDGRIGLLCSKEVMG